MKRYIDYLIRSEEHRVDEMLFLQIKDKNDLCYGLMRGDVIEAKPTIYMMATALALYLNSRSRYYKSENQQPVALYKLRWCGTCSEKKRLY